MNRRDTTTAGATWGAGRETGPALRACLMEDANPPGLLGRLRRRVFGIAPGETTFEARGFRGGDAATRARLENVGAAFSAGYHAALEFDRPEEFAPVLDRVELHFRGFAYEGAAMGLALRDWLTPWARTRFDAFVSGAGDAHAYMAHVGAGWVLARVPGSVEKFLARFDPLTRWLLIDGYGFHEGFFRWPRYIAAQPVPARLRGYARRVFDQGLGRCLWFIEGAEVPRIVRTIAAFPAGRIPDLWSGIGLACVYAGEIMDSELSQLRESAGGFAPQLAQGAAFAAKARQRAGNLSSYQDAACAILCGMTAREAAQVTDDALAGLPADGAEPAYETWRRRIQQHFAQTAEACR